MKRPVKAWGSCSVNWRGGSLFSCLHNGLRLLTRLLCKYYGTKVIVLIDEYDVPLDKAYQNGHYPQMVELIRSLLSPVLKTNESLRFAVVTRCLRIAGESIFTGLNNFKVRTLSDAEYFGFTDGEVRSMLQYYGIPEAFGKVKEWYDGYCIGPVDIYCPWDVLNQCDRLRLSKDAPMEAHWENSSNAARHISGAFCGAVKNGRGPEVQELYNEFLSDSVSIRDTCVRRDMKENYYHGMLFGLLQAKGNWAVKSNAESGAGYADIQIEIPAEKTGDNLMRQTVFDHIKKKYKVSPEYPWGDDNAVFRHGDNRKWFALVMRVGRDKLGLPGEEEAWVVNLKLDDLFFREALLGEEGILPAWHMNKRHWITVLLDGTVREDTVFDLIDRSFLATASAKKKLRPPKEWVVPANPRYYDIERAFEEAEEIDWKQGRGIKKGDTVYMYVAAPVSAILFRCRVTETDIPYAYADKNVAMTALMKIKLQGRYRPDQFPFEVLKEEYGIFAVRGPRGIPHSLSEALKRQGKDRKYR